MGVRGQVELLNAPQTPSTLRCTFFAEDKRDSSPDETNLLTGTISQTKPSFPTSFPRPKDMQKNHTRFELAAAPAPTPYTSQRSPFLESPHLPRVGDTQWGTLCCPGALLLVSSPRQARAETPGAPDHGLGLGTLPGPPPGRGGATQQATLTQRPGSRISFLEDKAETTPHAMHQEGGGGALTRDHLHGHGTYQV